MVEAAQAALLSAIGHPRMVARHLANLGHAKGHVQGTPYG
jgi:hypothetical protein